MTGAPGVVCPVCGLPAAGQAATVVARIGATLHELARDQDALLATLRAAAPGAAPLTAPGPPAATPPAVPADRAPPQARPVWAPPTAPPVAAPPPPWTPPVAAPPPRSHRRRLSPQQVLLGLGALLVVAGALAFVAVAWTRLGVTFQALVMLVVTAAACAASAWAARRGLRATEEALVAAGAALLAVDLGAAHALGLLGADAVPLRLWTALSCAAVGAVAGALHRATRSTTAWPLLALLAAQPVAALLLPPDLLGSPVGVAVVLGVAAADLAATAALRPGVDRVAQALAAVWAAVGVLGGLVLAAGDDAAESWGANAVLVAAGIAATVLGRQPRPVRRLPSTGVVVATASGVAGLALAGSLRTLGTPGPVVAGALGLAALTGAAAVLARTRTTGAGLLAAGTALTATGCLLLIDAERWRPLALLALAAAVPAATAALRLPAVRAQATGAALLAPAVAVLLARGDRWLPAVSAGMLLALVGAVGFAVGALRSGRPEEGAAPAAGSLAGLAAAATSGDVGAWGQVGLQLAVVGAAAGCYALVSGRRWVGALAVADLIGASWVAIAGVGVQTPEAYTLPAAAGLLLVAVPRLRAGARSWSAEGAAVAVGLLPSAFVVVAEPSALRLVLVVATAAVLTAGGALHHRQAPFVLGAAALAFVVVGRLGPYAPLLPRWVVLATAGLLLLVVGATYERRRQQAREAVAWVAQMS
ncbi:SCO7613 C-terminal domain-containing membrane protein [Modestobacter marinus]|uniref:SCO7613 C-terminal domain-containing membrane protein n=1 Tax=Modestobacter marinus TaxID=477641 RepID=UPI0027E07A81|nr:DUF2157 domain-containing protein [Modestobacter marinus]